MLWAVFLSQWPMSPCPIDTQVAVENENQTLKGSIYINIIEPGG
jgi:hypothetical protein